MITDADRIADLITDLGWLRNELAEANQKYTTAVSGRLEAEMTVGKLREALDRIKRIYASHGPPNRNETNMYVIACEALSQPEQQEKP